MKILIVDDSQFARNMMRAYSKQVFPDAEYIPAVDGESAIEVYTEHHLKREPIDLILLDQLMPGIDGLEALQRIMEINDQAFVVMLTANIQNAVRDEAFARGVRLFLNKPLKKGDFTMIKDTWLQYRPSES